MKLKFDKIITCGDLTGATRLKSNFPGGHFVPIKAGFGGLFSTPLVNGRGYQIGKYPHNEGHMYQKKNVSGENKNWKETMFIESGGKSIGVKRLLQKIYSCSRKIARSDKALL